MKSTASDLEVVPGGGSILDQGEFPFWKTTEHGIKFNGDCPREDWLKAVNQLTAMHESSGRLHFRAICFLADALNFGEEAYGEDYAQAIDETRKWMQISSKTIHNAMWVMKQIPATRRRELLTLSHHEAVASLEPQEQDELLEQAVRENMTVSDLRKEVAARHPKTKRGGDRKPKDTSGKIDIQTAVQAKDAATQLSNYLTANEDKITEAWKPLLEHFYKLFRRHWMTGHKR